MSHPLIVEAPGAKRSSISTDFIGVFKLISLEYSAPILDETAVASLYSALTGVLAGFAFAGIILIATERTSSSEDGAVTRESREAPLVLLLAAFLGLIMTSLTYAIIAGEKETNERAAIFHVVAGSAFAVSALALLSALHVLINKMFPDVSSWMRYAVGFGAPLVSSIYVATGCLQALNLAGELQPKHAWWAFGGVALVHALGIYRACTTSRSTNMWWTARSFASCFVVIVFVSSISVAALQAVGGSLIPTAVAWCGFLVVLVIMGLFTAIFGAKDRRT